MINTWKAPGQSGERPPAASEFANRAVALAAKVEKFSREKVEKSQAALFHQRKTDDEIANIWMALFMSIFATTMRELGATKGGALVAQDHDFRVAQRIRAARTISYLADALGWKKVKGACLDVMEAREDFESQFALLDDWQEQTSRVERLQEDFGATVPLEGYSPFTSQHLVLFYQARYYEKLTKALIDQLPRDAKAEQQWVNQATEKTPYLMKQAVDDVKQNLTRPKRYAVEREKFELALRAGDTDFSEILRRHPKTQALVAAQKKLGLAVLYPVTYHGQAFMWFLPSLDDLTTQVRRLGPVKMAVAAVIPDEDKLTNQEWNNALEQYMAPLFASPPTVPAGAQAIIEAIFKVLLERREEAWKALVPKTQDAIRVDRQVLAHQINKGLERYGKDDITYYGVPNDIIRSIQTFAFIIQPVSDRPLHIAALVLEIAAAAAFALRYDNRYDVIIRLLAYFQQTQETAVERQAELLRTQPAPLLPQQERSANWIQGRLEKLAPAVQRFQKVRAHVQTRFGFSADARTQRMYSMVYPEAIEPGMDLYGAQGGAYKIFEVKKSFVFHPAYGQPPFDKDSPPTAYSPPQLLDENGEAPLLVATNEVLLVIEAGGTRTNVMADEPGMSILTDLSFAIEQKAFQLDMANLEYLIRAYMDLMMDAAELIPGVGLAVTATRVAQAVAEFYDEGGYDAVEDLINGQIQQYLERLWQQVKEQADPEHLWMLFLFGDERLDALMMKLEQWGVGTGGSSKGRRRRRVKRASRLGLLKSAIEACRKLGRFIFK